MTGERTCEARISEYMDNYACGAPAGSHGRRAPGQAGLPRRGLGQSPKSTSSEAGAGRRGGASPERSSRPAKIVNLGADI
jgi:hypothetical protein